MEGSKGMLNRNLWMAYGLTNCTLGEIPFIGLTEGTVVSKSQPSVVMLVVPVLENGHRRRGKRLVVSTHFVRGR